MQMAFCFDGFVLNVTQTLIIFFPEIAIFFVLSYADLQNLYENVMSRLIFGILSSHGRCSIIASFFTKCIHSNSSLFFCFFLHI